MTTVNYTPLLGLALPTTGDLSGIWGVEVNNAITSLTDSAVAGSVVLNADADVTLTVTNGVANQARNAVIIWAPPSGTITRTITAPAKSKVYVVINASTTQSIKLVGTGPTTGVTIVAGERCVVAWGQDTLGNTDFFKIASSDGSAITGVVPPVHGGTGQSSYAVGDTIYASGTTAISKLPIGAAASFMTSSGTAPQWTAAASAAVGNLLGGVAYQVPYQTAPNTTGFVNAPTAPGTVLGWTGSAIDWVAAPAATTATNIAGGAANQIVYQTATSVTGFIPAPTTPNTSLTWSGSAFQWSANPLGTVTSVNVSGGTSGLTFSGGPITGSGTITLSGGTLSVARGGTGISIPTTYAFLRGFGGSWIQGAILAGPGISIVDGGFNMTISSTSGSGATSASYFACQFG